MNNAGVSEDLRSSINRLKQGLLIDNPRIVLMAHAKTVSYGASAVQPILSELKKFDFKDISQPNIVNLITGLAIALHDLDEGESKAFLSKALEAEVDTAVERVFSSLRQFSLSDYVQKYHGEILILEKKSLGEKGQAIDLVSTWLRLLPTQDIEGISRLYIIDKDSNYDYAGYHLGYLDVIVLVWDVSRNRLDPIRVIERFFDHKTLYHEVGHHCLDHIEFGQDPKQEKEADDYAYKHLGRYYQSCAN